MKNSLSGNENVWLEEGEVHTEQVIKSHLKEMSKRLKNYTIGINDWLGQAVELGLDPINKILPYKWNLTSHMTFFKLCNQSKSSRELNFTLKFLCRIGSRLGLARLVTHCLISQLFKYLFKQQLSNNQSPLGKIFGLFKNIHNFITIGL